MNVPLNSSGCFQRLQSRYTWAYGILKIPAMATRVEIASSANYPHTRKKKLFVDHSTIYKGAVKVSGPLFHPRIWAGGHTLPSCKSSIRDKRITNQLSIVSQQNPLIVPLAHWLKCCHVISSTEGGHILHLMSTKVCTRLQLPLWSALKENTGTDVKSETYPATNVAENICPANAS